MKQQKAKRINATEQAPLETTGLVKLEFSRAEVNLLVFPFFALTTKGLKKRLKTEFRAVVERAGEQVEILWHVSANAEYGYPGLFDRQVHRAIEQIITERLREQGKIENPIPLGSLYGLCQRIGLQLSKDGYYSGRTYRSIKRALERIRATSIKSEGTFYQKGRKQWVSKVFGLYDAVVFRGEELSDGTIADTNYLYLSDLYLQSINSFYVKPLDYQYQRSLRSHIASRLYEILGVKFYGIRKHRRAEVCFRYSTLAQLLPVEQYRYLSHAKKQLDPGHEELVATGFLLSYEWRKTRDKNDWLLYYRPGQRAWDEIERAKAERGLRGGEQRTLPGMEEDLGTEFTEPEPVALLSAEQEALVAQLINLNVSEGKARDLVQTGEPDTIQQWIEAINYANPKDKAAYIVAAIQERWQVPERYQRAKRRQEQQRRASKAQLAKQQAEQQELREQAREMERLNELYEEKKRQEEQEMKQLDELYEELSPAQREEVDREALANFPPFVREEVQQQPKGQAKGLSAALFQMQRYEVLRAWRKQGKL